MKMPSNAFKRQLQAGQPQTGIWVGLVSTYAAEIAATAGFDWLLLDAEHTPNELSSLLAQLQALAAYGSHPIVRPPTGDAVLIKRYLDIGVQNLLIPMVETAEQAAELVAATRYPPRGIRGVGHVLARASRWGQVDDYLSRADDEICLMLQVESPQALANLEAIAAVDGVDGVFIGPADLSASMGHLGNASHPEVTAAISDAVKKIRAAGKAAGIVTVDEQAARDYLAAGCTFVGVGIDTLLYADALRGLAERFRK